MESKTRSVLVRITKEKQISILINNFQFLPFRN